MRSSRNNLGYGMMLTALGAGLCQYVIIGLIGIIIMFIALYMFLRAAVLESPEKELALPSAICVKLLYIIGILSCMAVAFYISAMAFNTLGATRLVIPIPFQLKWYTLGLTGLIPALLISIGIYYQKGWSQIECLAWGLAVYSISPATFIVFRIFLSLGFPLTV